MFKLIFLILFIGTNIFAQAPPATAVPTPEMMPAPTEAPTPAPSAAKPIAPPAAVATPSAPSVPVVEKSNPDDTAVLSTDSEWFKPALYQPSTTEVEDEAKIWASLEGKTKAQVQQMFRAHEKIYFKSPRAAVLNAVYLAEIGRIIQAHKFIKPVVAKFPDSTLPKLIEDSILTIARHKPGYGIQGLVKKRYDQYVEVAKSQPRL